jgi:ATP-dependent Clp protease ATP-binding subunit ClpX
VPIPSCSFCGKSRDSVKKLIGSPKDQKSYICEECVATCNGVLEGREPLSRPKISAPREVKRFLDDYVVGQESAKKRLAVGVYNHHKRIWLNQTRRQDQPEIQKSNILLIGPTGTGKTLLVQTLARMLDVPFAMADATTLTEHGYVGEDVEAVIVKLLRACNNDLEKAQTGIVYIDEIDKVGKKDDGVSAYRDVSGEGVKQCFLKMLEGMVVRVPDRGNDSGPGILVDTTNILFICGGTFVGIEKIIAWRIGKQAIGFKTEYADVSPANGRQNFELLSQVQPEDIQKFGLIPEFVGRIPIIGVLDELDETTLVNILTQPKNALVRQYQKIAGYDGADLQFTRDALRAIAHEALDRKIGARGLRMVMEELMLDFMFALPQRKGDGGSIAITKKLVVAPSEERKRMIATMIPTTRVA